ncbi:MAG: hypothetical protein NC393_12180 [Clostridium sp.]|nr:hypothetical protein [Clostridium sp.]MCM1172865.1 hypothetical protein [Clostridium sp.]
MSIKDSIKKVTINEAKNMIANYDYALVYEISNMFCHPISESMHINWDEIQDAYFYNLKGELHVFCGDELSAVCFEEPANAKYIDRKYKVNERNNINGIGSTIIKREYIDYDEDGQLMVVFSRLVPSEEV